MKKVMFVSIGVFFLPAVMHQVLAHCEIPCGIYDDQMRIDMLTEHITTIEKSMQMITQLGADGQRNENQLVRWITNKEAHANQIQEIVCQYFLTQRLKPVEDTQSPDHAKYVQQLTALHRMLVYAMKAKQTTDVKNVELLRSTLVEFRRAYFGPKTPEHKP